MGESGPARGHAEAGIAAGRQGTAALPDERSSLSHGLVPVSRVVGEDDAIGGVSWSPPVPQAGRGSPP
jgi:hypothetical protein